MNHSSTHHNPDPGPAYHAVTVLIALATVLAYALIAAQQIGA